MNIRLTIDMQRSFHALIHKMGTLFGMSKADVVREALQLQWFLLGAVSRDAKLVLRYKDGTEETVLLFKATLMKDGYDAEEQGTETKKETRGGKHYRVKGAVVGRQ